MSTKNKSLLFIIFLFLSFSVNVNAQNVVVNSIKINGESIATNGSESITVEPGADVWISAEIQNRSGSWSGYGQLVMWVEGYDNVDDVVSHGFDSHEIYTSGASKWNEIYQENRPTSSVSVEAIEGTWGYYELQNMDILITAPAEGSFTFLVRGTFSNTDWDIVSQDPDYNTGKRDDQGYYVYKYTVNIAKPKYSVYGKVKSSRHDFDVIPNTTLRLYHSNGYDETVTSKYDGSYSFSNVPQDDGYVLDISHPDYSFTTSRYYLNLSGNTKKNIYGRTVASVDISYQVPDFFILGQPFEITVTLQNDGQSVGNIGTYLDVAFPQYDATPPFTVQKVSDNGFSDISFNYVGQSIYGVYNNEWQETSAEHLLVSGDRGASISSGTTISYKLKITATSAEEIKLRFKGSIGDSREPTSGTIGQQNIWEKEVVIPRYKVEPQLVNYQLESGESTINIHTGEPVDVTVSGKNVGNGEALYGGIALQVRQAYTEDQEMSETHSAYGATSGKSVWWKGEALANDYTAEYLHIEPTWENWGANLTKTLNATLTPREPGEYEVFAKMYLADPAQTAFRDPSGSSPNTDHQNEATVKVGTIKVTPPEPQPSLISYQFDNGESTIDAKVGEPINITVKGKNIGEGQAMYGGMAVQVRNAFLKGAEVTEAHTAVGANPNQSVWWKGQKLANEYVAQYLHIEPTWDNWSVGETKTLNVTITPQRGGQYPVYTKMYLADELQNTFGIPTGSLPNTDHQNEATYQIGTINVVPPGNLILQKAPTVKSKFYANGTTLVQYIITNQGETAQDVYISPSVSNGWEVISATDDIGTSATIYYPYDHPKSNGTPIVTKSGDQIEPEYPLIDWQYDQWTQNTTKTFSVLLKNTGSNEKEFFNIRWAWNGYTKPRPNETLVGMGTTLDQQGHPTFRFETDIIAQSEHKFNMLAYHNVGTKGETPYWITPEKFQKQMEFLSKYGFNTVSLNDVYLYKIGQAQLPSNSIVITFDDGYKNFYENAYPVLKEFNFTATNFLITDYIASDETGRRTNDWDRAYEESSLNNEHLIWPEVLEMSQNNISFYSHSSTHPSLPALSNSALPSEIVESKLKIENELSTECNFFSYPYTEKNENVTNTVRAAGYDGAVDVNDKIFSTNSSDMFTMDRLGVLRNWSLLDFAEHILPNFQRPELTVSDVQYFDSNGNERTTFSPGETIEVLATIKNLGATINSVVSLNIDKDKVDSTSPIYDSHTVVPSEDQMLEFPQGQSREVSFQWTIPTDIETGQMYTAIGLHGEKYVLWYGGFGWSEGFYINTGEHMVIPEEWIELGTWEENITLFNNSYNIRYFLGELSGYNESNTVQDIIPVVIKSSSNGNTNINPIITDSKELDQVVSFILDKKWRHGFDKGISEDFWKQWEENSKKLNEAFDPNDPKIVSGTLFASKCLFSIGSTMLVPSSFSSMTSTIISSGGLILSLGGSSLEFINSVTALPQGNQVSSAMSAIGSLDPDYKNELSNETERLSHIRNGFENLNQYSESMQTFILFPLERFEDFKGAWTNFNAGMDPVLANTSYGEIALRNANDYVNVALISSALAVGEKLIYQDWSDLGAAINCLWQIANLNTSVMEVYANQLSIDAKYLNNASNFSNFEDYLERISKYNFKAIKFYEVFLELLSNFQYYVNQMNEMGPIGNLSMTRENIEFWDALYAEQKREYGNLITDIAERQAVKRHINDYYPTFTATNTNSIPQVDIKLDYISENDVLNNGIETHQYILKLGNFSKGAINNIDLNFTDNNELIENKLIDVLGVGESKNIVFNWVPTKGKHILNFQTVLSEDDNPNNNTIQKEVYIAPPPALHTPKVINADGGKVFTIRYFSENSQKPDEGKVLLHIDGNIFSMEPDKNDYSSDVMFQSNEITVGPGVHYYFFTTRVNSNVLRYPEIGEMEINVEGNNNLAEFGIISPEMGSAHRGFPIHFQWESNNSNLSDINYSLILSKDPEFSQSTVYSNMTKPEFTVEEDLLEGTYYWRVKAEIKDVEFIYSRQIGQFAWQPSTEITPEITSLTLEGPILRDPINIQIQYNDENNEINKLQFEYSLDKKTWQFIDYYETPMDHYEWVSNLNSHQVWIRVRGLDNNNWSTPWFTSESYHMIDNSKPEIVQIDFIPKSVTATTESISVKASIQDTLSGINSDGVLLQYGFPRGSYSDYLSMQLNEDNNWGIKISKPADGWDFNEDYLFSFFIKSSDNIGNTFESKEYKYIHLNSKIINLYTGWNIFSSVLAPTDLGIQNIFSEAIEKGVLQKVQDEAGNSLEYLQEPINSWENGIGDWQETEGYYARVNADYDLLIEGQQIELPITIPLTSGWNIISYPLVKTFVDALGKVQPLIDEGTLIKVQDETGNAIEYIPAIDQWINDIGTMASGEGYYLKVSQNTSLNLYTIDRSVGTFATTTQTESFNKSPKHFIPIDFVGNPYHPMNIYITNLDLAGYQYSEGDEIAVFDGNTCLAASVIDPENLPVSLICPMDDPATKNVDGFVVQNGINLKIWNQQSQQSFEVNAEEINIQKGEAKFSPRSSLVVGFSPVTGVTELYDRGIPTEVELSQNFPNPFNPVTTIRFALPKQEQATLAIYNLRGKRIKTLIDQELPAGYHQIEWNGTNQLSQPVASGIYIYTLRTESTTYIMKLALIR